MRAATTTRTRLASLLFLQTLVCGAAYAQTAAPDFSAEEAKQKNIYHDKAAEFVSGYVTDRTLEDYASALPAEFGPSLANLGPDGRWLDIGAGMGQAIMDYYSVRYDMTHAHRGKKGRAVAMSIEDRRNVFWYQTAARLEPDQMRYVFSKGLRDYSLEELGRFDVITDVIGGFSYTANLSLFMEKVLSFLTVNGKFYTVLQDVRWESGGNTPYYKGAPFLTEIRGAAGADVGVCSWLKSISCVEVTCESKPGWKPPLEVYRVHKVCENTMVPALERVRFTAGTPPERAFKLAIPPATAPAETVSASR